MLLFGYNARLLHFSTIFSLLMTSIFKNATLALAATLLLLLTVNSTFAQSGDKKVALTTFFVDRQLDISGLPDNNKTFISQVMSMSKDTNFNLTPMLVNFKKTFFNEYAKNFTFSLLPESEVTQNEGYKAYPEPEMSDYIRPIVADGYKIMYPGTFLSRKENRAQNEMLELFPTADGVMFVFMRYGFYTKAAIGGLGAAGIRAVCHIWLYNKEGKAVFKIGEGATSKGTVALVAGVPLVSVEKILPLCKDATDRLLEDLMDRLPKMAKKAGEKL